ncbi:DUF2294 domain-containing protein [Pseudalkalibacillus decolorationis]|uniref:DUF2294 domain-containing protein n=1 Tax=Pseudalkalibacillus decolorationis TaxID=163879 RepID=UPI00214989B3|nr:DUF2294 domain-containing protein [Pseudalkalibacillus decolorationis]
MEIEKQSIQSEIASFIGKMLRDNFGKGPGSVYVSIADPFVTIYVKGFLSPMERVLMGNQKKQVEKTRDLLMESLGNEMKAYMKSATDIDIEEFYYDWSLEDQSGIFMGVGPLKTEFPSYMGQNLVHDEIAHMSKLAEKSPDVVESFLINSRTLIIRRDEILVQIEKEFISSGYEEILRLTKRSLEKRLLSESRLESILNVEIADVFIDWDFDSDKSYVVLILNPNK